MTTFRPCPPARSPTEGVSPVQFFLANFHAERLAGTHSDPRVSEAPEARPEQAVPSQDGQDDAILVAAATR